MNIFKRYKRTEGKDINVENIKIKLMNSKMNRIRNNCNREKNHQINKSHNQKIYQVKKVPKC